MRRGWRRGMLPEVRTLTSKKNLSPSPVAYFRYRNSLKWSQRASFRASIGSRQNIELKAFNSISICQLTQVLEESFITPVSQSRRSHRLWTWGERSWLTIDFCCARTLPTHLTLLHTCFQVHQWLNTSNPPLKHLELRLLKDFWKKSLMFTKAAFILWKMQ